MANLKDIRGRIKSVKSTQQVTKAMKMVAAAKLRKAQDRMFQLRPYAGKLREIMGNLIANMEGEIESPFVEKREVENVLIVLITSDRGLCGGFNNNLIKELNQFIAENYADYVADGKIHFLCTGRKGYEFYSRRDFKTVGKDREILSDLTFENANKITEEVFEGFKAGKWDKVHLVFNEFKNVMAQNKIIEDFLPISIDDLQGDGEDGAFSSDYIFEPSKEEIVTDLIPKSLKLQLFRGLLESNASEQGARMMAMDSATENAEDLLKGLKLAYNKARQAAITKEILEIVGGADALDAG